MSISYIETKRREDFPEFAELFNLVESFMGYLPNAYLLMADKPDLMHAFAKMSASVFKDDILDIQSKQLIALASSLALDANIVNRILRMELSVLAFLTKR